MGSSTEILPERGRSLEHGKKPALIRLKSISAGEIKTGLASWSTEDLARLVERLGKDVQYQRIADKLRSCGFDGLVFSDDDGATECVRLIAAETGEDLNGLKLKKFVTLFRDLRMDAKKEAAYRASVADGLKLKKLVNLFRDLRMDPKKEAADRDNAPAPGGSSENKAPPAAPMPPAPLISPAPPPVPVSPAPPAPPMSPAPPAPPMSPAPAPPMSPATDHELDDLEPVQKDAVALARKLATEGGGEKTTLHGFTLIVGDRAKLMEMDDDGDGVIGVIKNPMFDVRDRGVTVKSFKQVQPLAKEDGAIVIDNSGVVLGGNYGVGDVRKGDASGGGMRHQAASAVAQQAGGCFVVKVSEDACTCAGGPAIPGATLAVFNKRKMPKTLPVVVDAKAASSMELEQLEAKLKEATVVQLKTVAEAAAKEKVQKGEALVLAAQGGVGYAVDAQLAAGADVNHMDDEYGATALMVAALKGHTDVAATLIAADADVNVSDETGSTALMLAAQGGYADVANVLLDTKRVDLEAEWNGMTALQIALHFGKSDVAALLREAGARG